MSVVLETTIGDITVDLFLKERPNACLNFLKLCKIKYYNLCIFHKVERNFIAQTGDPTSTGRGGESVFSHLYGEQAKYFDAETKPRLKHEKLGTLSMVNNGNNMNGSQFFLTLGENITYLDEVHTVFGEVAEGFDVLLKINEAICDPDNRPYQDIRITHTVVLHDPYEDPPGLNVPDASPVPTREQLESNYIGADEEIDDNKGKNAEEIEEKIKDSEAKARATILEMVGDIPDADVKPPENVLFVCKLNPVTTSEDLEIIFSRFGPIVSCEVIKDRTSGESLQYAFIEFENEEECENAYFKMDNVLIDDRRIHVDFSQSVSKLNWNAQNKFPKQGSGRFQNFLIKDRDKRSDGYEMIFDMDTTSNRKADNKNRNRSPTRRQKRYSPGPQNDKRQKSHFSSRDTHKQKDKYFKEDETSYEKYTNQSRTKSDRGYDVKELSSKEKSRSREHRSPVKKKSKHDYSDSENTYRRSQDGRKRRHDSSSSSHSSSESPSLESQSQKVKSKALRQRSKETLKGRKQDSYPRGHSSSPESYSKEREHSSKQKYKSPSRSFEKHKRATKENPSYRRSRSVSLEISNKKAAVKTKNRKSPSTSPESSQKRKKKASKRSYRRSQSKSPVNSKKYSLKQPHRESPLTSPDLYKEEKASRNSRKQSPGTRSMRTSKQAYHRSLSSSPEPSYEKKKASKSSNRRSRSPKNSERKTAKQTYRSPSTSPESSSRKKKTSKHEYRFQSRSPKRSGKKAATREYSRSPSTSPEFTSRRKKVSKNSHRGSKSRSPDNSKKNPVKQVYRESSSPEVSHKKKKAQKSSYRSRSRSPDSERKSSKQRYKSRSPESSRRKKSRV